VALDVATGAWQRIGPASDPMLRMPTAPTAPAAIDDRVHDIPADIEYLRFPPELRGPLDVERWSAVVAQRVLRRFAAGLSGFGQSSLGYLWRNFLDFDAEVEGTPDRWVARLGAPPLNLILSVTGRTRTDYRLAVVPERLVAVHQ
jgi:hypothetical protein